MVATVVSLAITIPVVDLFGMNGVSWVGVGSYLLAVLSLVAFFVRDCKRLDSGEEVGEPVEQDDESTRGED